MSPGGQEAVIRMGSLCPRQSRRPPGWKGSPCSRHRAFTLLKGLLEGAGAGACAPSSLWHSHRAYFGLEGLRTSKCFLN